MIRGNQIHDNLLDHLGIHVIVDDAVSMAGDECGVQRLRSQVDIFGINPVNQVANLLRGAEFVKIVQCNCLA